MSDAVEHGCVAMVDLVSLATTVGNTALAVHAAVGLAELWTQSGRRARQRESVRAGLALRASDKFREALGELGVAAREELADCDADGAADRGAGGLAQSARYLQVPSPEVRLKAVKRLMRICNQEIGTRPPCVE